MQPTHRSTFALAAALALLAQGARAERLYRAWTQEFDPASPVSQGAKAVAVDPRGHVIVTGFAFDNANERQFYTAKYDALDGHLIWSKVFNPTGDATPNAIACDPEGNVAVTGNAQISGNINLHTVKYGPDGTELWSVTYDGSASGLDDGIKVAFDGNGDVVVTARSFGNNGNPTGGDFYTVKYAKSNGAVIWSDRFSTPGSRDDAPADLAIDSQNNVIVVGEAATGSGILSFHTRKLNANGSLAWEETVDTGGDGGATAVAVDAAGQIFVTGLLTDLNGYHGYYTRSYSTSGSARWTRTTLPTTDDFTGRPTDLAVGPDGHPIVTGWIEDNGGVQHAYTVKYSSSNGAELGAFYDGGLANATTGVFFGDTRARGLVIDGAGRPIVIAESDNADLDSDIIITQYDETLTYRLGFDGFAGSFGSDDAVNGIALKPCGGVAVVGTPIRTFAGTGRSEIVTMQLNRFIETTGDLLPPLPGASTFSLYAKGNAPAVAASGTVAARITLASGKTKLAAILAQGGSGGTRLPAIQSAAAPGANGGKFDGFSDPIVAPGGAIAFAARLSGVPSNKSNGAWTDLGGTLHLALQQGTPVPGMTENLASILSLSLRDDALLALVKVAGPAASNTALVRINAANQGTLLLRTGEPVTVAGAASTVKSIGALAAAKASPGDGRWHADQTAATATLADGRSVLFRFPPSGAREVLLATGSSVAPGLAVKSFGPPAVAASGTARLAATVTFAQATGITADNDSAILRTGSAPGSLETVAAEGETPLAAALAGLTFAGFSDPLVHPDGPALFLATLKGQGATAANNRALLYGDTHAVVARTGGKATDSAGATPTGNAPVWSDLSAFALAAEPGAPGHPIFVAKLAGAGVTTKNDVGLWAVDSEGAVRRLLREGDLLDGQTVKSFTLLKPVATAPAAARSVSSSGTVTALVKFTNKRQALVKIPIP